MNPFHATFLYLLLCFLRCSSSLEASIDCVPDSYIHGDRVKELCHARGCNYSPSNPRGPICTFPQNYGYKLRKKSKTPDGWKVTLERDESLATLFGNDSQTLIASFIFQSEHCIRIKISDGSERFEVPITLDLPKRSKGADNLYEVQFSDSPIFSFEIIRKSTQKVVLSTKDLPGLIFSAQFIQIPLSFSEGADVYGLGENEQSSLRHDMDWKSWNGWARDSTPRGLGNMYGVFPLMTILEPTGDASTLAVLNSNAQEWVMVPPNKFVYRTIGGLLDIFLFLGPSPEESLAQSSSTFGKYYIPPYWSLGHHLCRFGYENTDSIRAAFERTLKFNIPLDTQWVDIDYMHRFMDFTYDPYNFKDLPDFVDELHEKGKHFVPIIDPGIDFESEASTYKAYKLGQQMDVWVKRAGGSPMVGKVWPFGRVHFPDFFKENTTLWWEACVKDLHSQIKIDGLWIDMNEPSNFGDGDVEVGCGSNTLNDPPYLPRNLQGLKLASKTICPDHTHSLKEKTIPHYDLHSLYGLSEARATIAAVRQATKTRGFVLSRSTYLSSGRYSAKWLGDNMSLWKHLKESIIGIIQFNMFGVPHVGADICGFNGNTTAELCARWYQVGAFYPFSRNHNTIGSVPQDPGVWGHKIASIIRSALRFRYNLLPHLYTLFYHHSRKGSTVVRALWNVFPGDAPSRRIDEEFMWGEGLLIAPVVAQGASSKEVYLPPGSRWYDFTYFVQRATISEVPARFVGRWSQIHAPLEIVPLFLRGGFIYPLQKDDEDTSKSRSNDFMLEVALDSAESAQGDLFYDDGISEMTVENGAFFRAEYLYEGRKLSSKVISNGYGPMKDLYLSFIGISGLGCKQVRYVLLNNQTVIESISFKQGRLQIRDISLRMNEDFTITLKEG